MSSLESVQLSCCKFWISWVGVNTKFTTWQLCIYTHPVNSKFTTWHDQLKDLILIRLGNELKFKVSSVSGSVYIIKGTKRGSLLILMFSFLDHRKREMHVHFHIHLDEEDHHDHKSNAEQRHCEKSSPGMMGHVLELFCVWPLTRFCLLNRSELILIMLIQIMVSIGIHKEIIHSIKIVGKKSVN